MELLGWIDQVVNAPKTKGLDETMELIGARLPQERRGRNSEKLRTPRTTLGSIDDDAATPSRRSSTLFTPAVSKADYDIVFDADEDLISHRLCRYAFCMSERWRKWFVMTEDILLRARIRLEMAKSPTKFLVDLMEINGIACEKLSEAELLDDRIREYIEYRRSKAPDALKDAEGKPDNYYAVPLSLATRLIKNRYVLCRKGKAILFRDQVQDVFIIVFKAQLNRGLHEAFLARSKLQNLEDETELATVTQMLDVFMDHFISDPADNLQEGTAGSVRAGDVQGLAQTHFPLCMRMIDQHLRREGHLKHHGRFTYGLFLKAIGLSLDDSMALFSSLMTVKGGGSLEAFAKTAYGYNVRHNYGMEGKKTSYSSATCATILSLPPSVDKNDCHGCPFRFRDEGAFRTMLQREQKNPLGNEYPDIRPSAADIEDIVQDCKGQHYTRACYKYFMATHPNAKRDTLFRSPYEYFSVSREVTEEIKTEAGSKRSSAVLSPNLKENDIKPRME
ncbi:DNA primase large subunit [Angomonas deanei]|nr:DNA primase large subunit [Angomonas deanei]|eukprot:EPY41623.1 DNA primase large subunit [Angomonas deanei]